MISPTSPSESDPTAADRAAAPPAFSLGRAARTAIAGVLMGIANLIPGVSGGTMILALGLYEEFIDGVANLSAFRFTTRRILFLGILTTFAGGAIVGLAGAILYLLFAHTIAMYAAFIGLTLGGAPLLTRSLRPIKPDVVAATIVGFALMVGVFLLKGGAGLPHNPVMDLVSGVVGATTMVLPGISGSYMLLVMDQYERVVGAVDTLKDGLRGGDRAMVMEALRIAVPVGIGVVAGVVGLSNLLKVLLRRYHRATVGVLLGILLGSVLGLWPFDQPPKEKSLERRSVAELRAFVADWRIPECAGAMGARELAERILDNWNDRQVSGYSPRSVLVAALLAGAGFGATYSLSRRRSGVRSD